ncbi:V-set and transmembrane domain-containing protein 2-like protein [Cololabis saira]|uniref:V-set and transmembrane domain-containing protein 2-like protein n=1 Tax=Cololabis saira TaxID=129043 RepID=UPI002AD1D36E|nr:V-set and transmembrane domain-containing protein 2-like protein [Cololabis saira]
MGAFGVMMKIVQYVGLYLQLNAALGHGYAEMDNHISGNARFTEVPHDITTHSGEDVEMACSFIGAGSPSYSLEIQWWCIKDQTDLQEKLEHITNNVATLEEMFKDATKISVVKVAGSNISHKLRLSSVKPSDEGMYECRVIDYSDPVAQRHRVRAFLRVVPENSPESHDMPMPEQGQRPQGNHRGQGTEGEIH